MSDGFVTARVYPGDMNALVKNMMKAMGVTDPNDAVSSFNRGEWQLVKSARAVTLALLTTVGTVSVATTDKTFVAKEKFVISHKADAKVKIFYLGNNFKSWFLGKVEQPIVGSDLRVHRLVKNSVDTPIITELGGEAKVETTLTEMFSLMEKQGDGQAGDLLTNSYANIFYIRDVEGVLRAVGCYWSDDSWRVDALPLDRPSEWSVGSQVFSRNSASE
jgi:hypothetical protein